MPATTHQYAQPEGADIQSAENALVSEFAFFDDWMERYQHIIDMGRRLPEFPETERDEQLKVKGCQSQVWLDSAVEGDRIYLRAVSDSAIVSGLIAMLLRVYSGRSAGEILGHQPRFIDELGLTKHLSPTRSNGLHAMIKTIYSRAAEAGTHGPDDGPDGH